MGIQSTDFVYVAGPMSGRENYNRDAFLAMEDFLYRKFDCAVLNPARFPDGMNYEWYMQMGLLYVRRWATAIVLLDGWQASPGANREVAEAKKQGLKIYLESRLREEEV